MKRNILILTALCLLSGSLLAQTLAFDDIGMNITTAITCFFKKCLATGEIPFTLSRQSRHDRLLAALKEAQEVETAPNAPTCTNPDKLEEFMLS